MQKIKFDVFKTWFDKDLTGAEIDFLIALSFYQNDRGRVSGVYYLDMMREAQISTQTFYDCKKSLEEKGVISVQGDRQHYDITITGNDFCTYTKEDYDKGEVKYLLTNSELFHSSAFKVLKPKQKLLVMDLYNILRASAPRGAKAFKIGRKNFVERYANTWKNGYEHKGLLNVTVRTLQKYMKWLKLFFTVVLRDGMYYILLIPKFGKKTDDEPTVEMEHLLEASCRKNKIQPAESKDEKIEKNKIVLKLVYARKMLQTSSVDLDEVIRRMIEQINAHIPNKRKWKRRLKDSLFRKILDEMLKESIA